MTRLRQDNPSSEDGPKGESLQAFYQGELLAYRHDLAFNSFAQSNRTSHIKCLANTLQDDGKYKNHEQELLSLN